MVIRVVARDDDLAAAHRQDVDVGDGELAAGGGDPTVVVKLGVLAVLLAAVQAGGARQAEGMVDGGVLGVLGGTLLPPAVGHPLQQLVEHLARTG